FEDLVDVYDATHAVGDEDDDDSLIAEELDDAQIVALADDEDVDDDEVGLRGIDEADEADGVAAGPSDEVELEYAGDLSDLGGARSAAQDMESDNLSEEDLDELDYDDDGEDRGHARP